MNTKYLSICIWQMSFILSSCGDKNNRSETTSTTADLLSEEASSESIATNLEEAIATLSDGNINISSNSLTLQNAGGITVEVARSCSDDTGDAIVSISKNLEGDFSVENDRVSVSRSIRGTSTITRTWKKDAQDMSCHENGLWAEIDWSDDGISGLNLSIAFERSREDQVEKTILASDTTATKDISWTAKGSREIQWVSHQDNDDGTFTRVHNVSSQVERTRLISSSRQTEDINLNLSIKTVEDSPLVISTIRKSDDKSLVSKTIESGKLSSSNGNNQTIISDFNNLKFVFDSVSCSGESGVLTASFFEGEESTASKIIELTLVDGSYTAVDITDPDNTEEMDEVDFEVCQLANFR